MPWLKIRLTLLNYAVTVGKASDTLLGRQSTDADEEAEQRTFWQDLEQFRKTYKLPPSALEAAKGGCPTIQ